MAEAELLYPEQVWDAIEAMDVIADVQEHTRRNLIRGDK